jgi:polyhydroxyalkanoate synthesis regulator phasin
MANVKILGMIETARASAEADARADIELAVSLIEEEIACTRIEIDKLRERVKALEKEGVDP